MKTHAPQGNRYHAPTHGGCRAAPRPAARAQRRHRARGKAQRAAAGRAQCRCTKNRDQRGAAAAPEGRTWPPTAPTCSCPRGLSCCSTPRCSCPATPPRAGKSPGSCRRPRPVPREGGRAWLPRCQGRGTTCTFWSKSCLRTCHKCASAKAPRLASSVGLAWTSSWLLLAVFGVILGAAWVRKAWVRGKRTKSAERGAARQLTYLFEIKAPRARRWPVGTARGTAMHSTT